MADGGLVAPTAATVRGARSITAVTAAGTHETATVVATDRASDLALLRVSTDLPVAPFTDDASTAAGRPVLVVAVAPRPKRPATMWSTGTVAATGATVTGGGATGMAAIDARAPGAPAVAGALLLDASGRVLGILDQGGRSAVRAAVFLPASLVLGVTAELAASGRVQHGWLGVRGHDAPGAPGASTTTTAAVLGGGGALVASVDPKGVAAGMLKPGDVIVSANGAPVRTMAELRNRLYVLGPGSPVRLGLWRGGRQLAVAVDLGTTS